MSLHCFPRESFTAVCLNDPSSTIDEYVNATISLCDYVVTKGLASGLTRQLCLHRDNLSTCRVNLFNPHQEVINGTKIMKDDLVVTRKAISYCLTDTSVSTGYYCCLFHIYPIEIQP